jgi:DNA-binding SARP family transcriptional activator
MVPVAASTTSPANAPLQLRLLGVPAWRVGTQAWRALATKDAVLLARLALDGQHPRSQMATWLWPDVPQPRAHANLRQRLFRLRQQCGELVSETPVGLRLADTVHCDVWRDGCAADANFGAPLLAGVAEADGEHDSNDQSHHDWLDNARRQWSARRADLLGGLAARHEAEGALAAALAATEQLLVIEPLLEHAWRRLMRLHTRRGDRAAALAAFERCEQVLRDELGVKPAPETLALLHQVESGNATESSAALAAALPAALLSPPRLVGREVELRAMATAWQTGRAFVLLGEAGMGKSRLMLACAADGPGRALAAARPGDEVVAYGSLIRLLRSMMRVAPAPDRLWPEPRLREELSRLLPELGPLPASPGRETLLHSALEQVFLAAPAAGLQALLFDDLQHCDETSRGVLQRLCGLPGLVWGFASRPAHGAGGPGEWMMSWLASSARLAPITLAALDDGAIQALLSSLQTQRQAAPAVPLGQAGSSNTSASNTGPSHGPAALHTALSRHCGGNPLFLLETLKHLHLQGGLAAWAHADTPALAPLPLPPSVHAVLTQRLATLGERAQNLARVAAVAGPEFSVAVAADVMAETALAVSTPWAELERAQVFRAQQGASVFAHESVLDAVRSGLPQALLAPLHAGIAISLQKNAAPPQAVARHFAAAGQPAAAAPMALAAAELALQQGRTAEQWLMLQQAAQWFAQAGDHAAAFDADVAAVPVCLVHQGVGPAATLAAALLPRAGNAAQRLALRLEQANVALASQDLATLQRASQAALQDATPGSAGALRAQALHATALAFAGEHTQALLVVAELQPGLQALPDARLAAELAGHAAMVFSLCGRTRDCVGALQQQLARARQVGDMEQEATALASLAGQDHNLGETEAALRSAQQAAVLLRRLGSAGTAFANDLNMVNTLIALNRYGQAGQLLEVVSLDAERMAVSTNLRQIVAEEQAALLLRLGQAAAAMLALGKAPAATTPRREIQQWMLRAQAAQMLGQPAQAQQAWLALAPLLAGSGDDVLTLVARAQASHCLPEAAAQAQLNAVLAAAQQAEFPAAQAQALMSRARLALASGAHAAALADAEQLWALRARARHQCVDEGVLCATVCEITDACADANTAQQMRQRAVLAFVQEAQAQVPAPDLPAWRAHPLRLALWKGTGESLSD